MRLKYISLLFLLFFFLIVSFYPTIYELSLSNKLYDPNREFILEHNYYWPDFNLYLSKIRQGTEGRLTALERYTSEPHQGSLIQEFYVVLGLMGRPLNLDPNFSYQLGRLILSPLLLLIVILLVFHFFKKTLWRILAFVIIFLSGSFPKIYTDSQGLHVGRFMEWWSNIDVVQRITFVPHILFGQVTSFFILYIFLKNNFRLDNKKLIYLIIIGNLTGLVFPPSLITLNSVVLLLLIIPIIKKRNLDKYLLLNTYYLILTIPSLLYIFLITKIFPWSALVDFHRTHPMMIPFGEYILGTGPIFFLGLIGIVVAVIKKETKFYSFIFWILTTFFFSLLFTHIQEQSPLRFTQTGLYIPLGILGTYFLYEINKLLNNKITYTFIFIYILISLFMMKVSLDWQTTFITQRAQANIPPVPYPPQTMYPLKDWMDGIRWIKNNTGREDVILAQITAGNFIPAYAGRTVYFGQANTVNYDTKQTLVDKFYHGNMSQEEAQAFLRNGRITYIFYSIQEKDFTKGNDLNFYYPFLKKVYSTDTVTIFQI